MNKNNIEKWIKMSAWFPFIAIGLWLAYGGFVFNPTVKHVEVLRAGLTPSKEFVVDSQYYKQYKILDIEYGNFKALKSKEVQELKDQLKAAGVKEKNLVSALSMQTSTTGTKSVSSVDTFKLVKGSTYDTVAAAEYVDSFTSISSTVRLRVSDSSVTVLGHDLAYQTKSRYSILYGYQNNGLFKPKQLSLTIVTDNPNTTIGKVQNFSIKEPSKKFYQKKVFYLFAGAAIGVLSYRYLTR